MADLFHFIRDLFDHPGEVIAAFVVGLLIAPIFLTYIVYWLVDKFNAKKIDSLEASTRDRERERDEARLLARKRKIKLAEHAEQIESIKASAAAAVKTARDKEAAVRAAYGELDAKYAKLGNVARTLKKQATTLNDQVKLIEKMHGQLWDLPVDPASVSPFRKLARHKAVIIAITNLKGGVGKTTLTANIAVTYCKSLGKRVLAIDLDFQASLTNLCLPAQSVAEMQIGTGRLVDNVFKDLADGLAERAFNNISQTREPKLHLLADSEKLARVEEEAKARWIMNPGGLDLRCALRTALHDPLFQDNFDVIVIDCPPRWTTASINAIAGCDYVLIPTQLDRVSSEAVPRLLGWLRDLRRASRDLYGNFEVLGVVANMAFPRDKLIAQEQGIWEELPAKCKATWAEPVHHFGTIIKEKSECRRAANTREFAALHPDLQPTFLQLVQEIETRRSAHESR